MNRGLRVMRTLPARATMGLLEMAVLVVGVWLFRAKTRDRTR